MQLQKTIEFVVSSVEGLLMEHWQTLAEGLANLEDDGNIGININVKVKPGSAGRHDVKVKLGFVVKKLSDKASSIIQEEL